MNIQWYPGHMTKAKRMMEENIKLIDLVIELLDARIPISSKNPDVDDLAKGKARLVILNKSDLADEKTNNEWISYYKEKGVYAIALNSRMRGFSKQVTDAILKACDEKIKRDLRRGIKNKPIRAMIVGIPNVGKSTFINTLSGKAAAKTGNKPGVTKGKQWIRIASNIEFLDTPGILWPKFDDEKIGEHIAFIGSVNEEIIDLEELALRLIATLKEIKPSVLSSRYDIEENQAEYDILKEIAINRNLLVKGGEPDTKRAAKLLSDDFRDGRLGRISLEKVD
ncbi:MAG: ribosome biogenesis GTPase YlqF [Lachnospiraceae bacterium]|nr:ribosome biogenesis GTPase YlqF [Lachnospiraceae bacterium]